MTSKVHGIRNRLFIKNGHECTIPPITSDLPMFQQSSGIYIQIKNGLIRARMCSELSYRARDFLQSQRNIEMERRNHLQHLFVIHPFSDFRRYWEIMMATVFFVVILMFPLDVCFYEVQMFENFTRRTWWRTLKLLLDIICLVDVGISFITGYCDNKRRIVVMEPKKIVAHYLMTYFILDIISSIPNDVAFSKYGDQDANHILIEKILMYSSFFKILRLKTFVTYCNNTAKNYHLRFASHKLKVLAALFLLYYHVVTCLCVFIVNQDAVFDKYEYMIFNKSRSNMPYHLLLNARTTYTFVLYQVCGLINNSGYLDANEGRYNKTSIIIWLVSRFLFMFLVAMVLQAIECKTMAKQKYDQVTNEIADYMKHKQLPVYLQKRIWTYFEFQFQKSYFREDKILNSVSSTLRQEIQMHSCKKLVENVDFFRDLPMSFLMRIVTVLHHETFMTNDVILKANTYGDCMYFIAIGTVAVYSRTGKEVCHLADGNHFGEIALVVKSEKRVASVVATECSEMYRLDRKDFMRALMPYPDLLTKIQYIAQERKEETDALDDRNIRMAETLKQTVPDARLQSIS